MRHLLPILVLLTAAALAQAGWKELGALPGGAVAWEFQAARAQGSVRVSGVSFTAGEYDFRVLDNPPAARQSLSAALAAAGAVAGVNGGYFHKDFTPLGLVISDGRKIHSFEKARLLSGILAARSGHRTELLRAGNFKPAADVREALQAGPWLVAGGQPVAGLDAGRLARRTVVANDGKNRWAILTISPVTLEEAARLLAEEPVAGWPIRNALNLDGGSSTSLVARAGDRLLFDIPSFGPVRNYLAIVPARR